MASLDYADKHARLPRRDRIMPPEFVFVLTILTIVLSVMRLMLVWAAVRGSVIVYALGFLLFPESHLTFWSISPDALWWIKTIALFTAGTAAWVFSIAFLIRLVVISLMRLIPRG